MSFFQKYALILLFCFSLSACNFFENTTVKIINPTAGFRITDDSPAPLMASVLVTTNRDGEVIPGKVWINNVGPVDWNFIPNQETNVGPIPFYVEGQQTIRVEVAKQNGSVVSDELKYLWVPYRGLDVPALALAKLAGSDSSTTGIILFGVIFLVIITITGLFVGKSSLASVVVIVWASVIVLILCFIGFSPVMAYVYAVQLLWTVFGGSILALIAFIASKGYDHSGADTLDLTFKDHQRGIEITVNAKRGSYTGPKGQPRPQLNGQAFVDSVKASFPPVEAYRQIRSQPDWQEHLPDPDLPYVDADFTDEN